jgi:hypothetical protein
VVGLAEQCIYKIDIEDEYKQGEDYFKMEESFYFILSFDETKTFPSYGYNCLIPC